MLECSKVLCYCFSVSLIYDLIFPQTNFCCFVIHSSFYDPWSFVCPISCFVVLSYSRKTRLHTHCTDFSIYFGSHQQTADTYSHGWSRPNTLPWRIGVFDVGCLQYCLQIIFVLIIVVIIVPDNSTSVSII